jgi:hypothetical protein
MDLRSKHPEATLSAPGQTVIYAEYDGNKTMFVTGATINMHYIRGMLFDSWSTCGNVIYGKEEKEYLDSRIGRE